MIGFGSILGACAALAFVLALIWGGQALARRRPQLGSGSRQLQLVETIALDGRRRLQLVRCGRRYLLVQTGGAQDLLIGWLPDDLPAAAPPA